MRTAGARYLSTNASLPKFYIVDSTLREGEQFSTTEFTTQDRMYIAKTLDKLGVDYIEMVNPAASQQAADDCRAASQLNLKAKILTHTRCHMNDVSAAVDTGVNGVNIYMATSPVLSKHSHGKGIETVIAMASEVISFVKDKGLEVRFSCEDSFRSDPTDLLTIYKAVDNLGVDRVGIADTVGVATPGQVHDVVQAVRGVIRPETGIEFHTHDDTGCCIANALVAIEAGATHIDTTVLGIGERNGITPLGGFLGRMYSLNKDEIMSRYNLKLLKHVEKYVARAADVKIPFNNYITGTAAFTHKAGVHSKAVMSDPGSYEVLNPADFGVDRHIQLAHRLTGWNAMAHRAKQLNLEVSDDQIKAATTMIKNLASERQMTMDEVDNVLMQLAQSCAPISSSSLLKRKVSDSALQKANEQAAEAMRAYEDAVARTAITSLKNLSIDSRPSVDLRVEGHLFDKFTHLQALLNRLLDLVVDSPCSFKVMSLDVPDNNEKTSSAVLRLWGDSPEVLKQVKRQMHALVSSNAPIAQCTLMEVDIEDEATTIGMPSL